MSTLAWAGFIAFVILMMSLDLFVFHGEAHEVKFKEALKWTVFWVSLALIFNVIVYFWRGPVKAMEFLTGYVIEESLSVDNLFVFLAVFSFFRVEAKYQHRILLWGIIGALVMRAVFILLGVALINKFSWIMYVFGAILIYTAYNLAFKEEKEIHPDQNPILKIFKKFMPVSVNPHGGHFFLKEGGRWTATPLFIVLLVIETTDIMFAVDSIPAVLAISRDPFIVFTSNVFAIMGLRSLYFVLAGLLNLFHYLNYGLAVILGFVGVKMLLSEHVHIPIGIALGVIGVVLITSVVASLLNPKKIEQRPK